jgi:hypothetical protein
LALIIILTFSCSVNEVEKKYYADGEDAYMMKKEFS